MTHRDLVYRAGKWLKNSAVIKESSNHNGRKVKCGVVATELKAGGSRECPDAIGWLFCGASCIVIECKTSRSDFLEDRHKIFRLNSHTGLGNYRYFMAPANLIRIDDLPENWGLLEVNGRSVTVAKLSEIHVRSERSRIAEISMLYSIARRAKHGERIEHGT